LPADLRERATALWKDYLDKLLTAAGLSKMRAGVVDEALGIDASLGDLFVGGRVSAGHSGLTMSVETCERCGATTVCVPVGKIDGMRWRFDPVHSDDGPYVCVAGVARLSPGGLPSRPALAQLHTHSETCRGRQNEAGAA
jgi:hypothetical protein